jgi:hypothetical protein
MPVSSREGTARSPKRPRTRFALRKFFQASDYRLFWPLGKSKNKIITCARRGIMYGTISHGRAPSARFLPLIPPALYAVDRRLGGGGECFFARASCKSLATRDIVLTGSADSEQDIDNNSTERTLP